MGVYLTVAELRAEPEVPDAPPPADDALEAIIASAEDQIDSWLGAWPVQTTGPSSGRKIVQADVEAWQWAKLKRATARLAARLHSEPAILAGATWGKVSGPDFTLEQANPTGRKITDVINPLNASSLRQLGARARA